MERSRGREGVCSLVNLPLKQVGLRSALPVKTTIICEQRGEAECAQCTCERFRMPNSVQEVVDENGEVVNTAESVICRCL